MAAARRKVRVGSISYTDPQGAQRRADAGAIVDVHQKDIDRFDEFNRLSGESSLEAVALATVADADVPDGGQPRSLAQALARRAAELDAREAALAGAADELDAKAADLDARAADLDAREAALGDEKTAEPRKPATRSTAKAKPAAAGEE
ncbi:hypothetical protein [Rhodococcus aetherivorans]|uniref:hypothetical protein n=1 Tax=Rhodococcus aetherivorans TaxID=191292 RepID=UPI00388E5F28